MDERKFADYIHIQIDGRMYCIDAPKPIRALISPYWLARRVAHAFRERLEEINMQWVAPTGGLKTAKVTVQYYAPLPWRVRRHHTKMLMMQEFIRPEHIDPVVVVSRTVRAVQAVKFIVTQRCAIDETHHRVAYSEYPRLEITISHKEQERRREM